MHSGAGQSSYRYGKSGCVHTDGITGALQTWKAERCTDYGRLVMDARRPSSHGLLSICDQQQISSCITVGQSGCWKAPDMTMAQESN